MLLEDGPGDDGVSVEGALLVDAVAFVGVAAAGGVDNSGIDAICNPASPLNWQIVVYCSICRTDASNNARMLRRHSILASTAFLSCFSKSFSCSSVNPLKGTGGTGGGGKKGIGGGGGMKNGGGGIPGGGAPPGGGGVDDDDDDVAAPLGVEVGGVVVAPPAACVGAGGGA